MIQEAFFQEMPEIHFYSLMWNGSKEVLPITRRKAVITTGTRLGLENELEKYLLKFPKQSYGTVVTKEPYKDEYGHWVAELKREVNPTC